MNTTLKISLLFCFCVFLCSCNNQNNSKKNSITQKQREDSLRMKLQIKDFDYVLLNPKADSITKEWPIYETLKNEVERIEDYTLQDMVSNSSTLEKTVDSLQKTIPKAVDTFPVTSRINVLKSKAKYLLLLSTKQQPKLKEIKLLAEEYPLEFNALNIQLNEVFIELPEFDD